MDDFETILGYDARERYWDLARLWPDTRRESFLLRTEVAKPLSTDTLVWPSMFECDGSRLNDEEPVSRPPWIGPNDSLWEALSCLRRHCPDVSMKRPYALVAITLADEDSATILDDDEFPYRSRSSLDSVSPDWRSLGYDVSDRFLLSGLTNCGYTSADELDVARRRWGPRLNEHHLFTELSAAQEFAAIQNQRVKEHAPFYPYRLWQIVVAP